MDDLDLGATVKGFSPGQKVFNRYTLVRILGRGGMGVVWLARDDKLEREVALKFLPEVMMGDKLALTDLKRETRRSLELTHSHIVRIYDFMEDGRTAAIAMEYIAGETLTNTRVDRPGHCYEPADIAKWVTQLCAALDYAHHKGKVIHRDLKPANLMIDAGGDLKVTDFGIATSIADSVSRVSKQVGSSGTPVYMSPQQMMGEKPAVTDDVYAVGATLHELLTGKPPFHTGNIILQVQSKVPPSIAVRREELGVTGGPIPREWEETIAACLAKEPAQRPGSAREVAHRLGLTSAMTATPFAPKPATARPPAAAPAAASAKAPGGRKLLPLFAGLVLLAVGAGYYYGFVVPREEAAMRQREEAAARQREESAARAAAARAADELQGRITAGKVTPVELEVIAREQNPRGAVARERLQVLQREREQSEQQSHQLILTALERLADNAPRTVLDDLDQQVRTYLLAAPERYRAEVEKSWERRRTAWLTYEAANRVGSLLVESAPAGANVTLYPRNERKTSPASFRDLRPGEVSFRVEKEGYEPQDVAFTIKPGIDHRVPVVRLAPLFGSVVVTSEPSGLAVVLEGANRRYEGKTPFTQEGLAPGSYRAVYQRGDWKPVVKSLTVEKGVEATAFSNLRGFTLDVTSTPSGAAVQIDGQPAGQTPLQLNDLEPRSYRIGLTLEGYEDAARTVALDRNTSLTLPMAEKPGYRLLQKLSAHPWRYNGFWGYAQLSFDPQGRIEGDHKIPMANVMQDVGRVIRNEAGGSVLVATFTPSTPYPFYVGEVRFQLEGEDSVMVTWKYNGKEVRYAYIRPGSDPAKAVNKR